MKRFITKVTVTGADDSTDANTLVEISKQYPFAEFGILLSKKHSSGNGINRFPSKEWLRKLIDIWGNSDTLNLSGHLCGDWVNKTLLGAFPNFDEIDNGLKYIFDRYQLNTHGHKHVYDPIGLNKVIKTKALLYQTIIFQVDGVNDIVEQIANAEKHTNIAALFDLSHGAGILPTEWPGQLTGINCGYAGGLGPDNVKEQVEKIASISGGYPTWIDAETKLRPDERVFDLDEVVKFLEAAKEYIL